jgi:DNA helicase-2/ATP-dependent DNA helicase PcrA
MPHPQECAVSYFDRAPVGFGESVPPPYAASPDQHLAGLNPAQLEAVRAVHGPVLIIAGPGSGKTRVIVHRIAHLITAEGVPPWNVLAVTFTNKAAREMRDRLEVLLGRRADALAAGTFHAQCSRILRRDGQVIGIDPRFAIFDDGDQIGLIRSILREMEIDEKRFAPRSFLSAISAAKSELIDVDQYSKHAVGFWHERVASIYRRYQELLLTNRALDFDDLILETVRLFTDSPETLAAYQDRFRYILVDEFQDTNIAQYRLVKLLAQRDRNVCVVGDEDQGVYSWRQADIRNLLHFEQDFPEAKVILLEQNYRSTQTILEAARSVISANQLRKDKKLWTENEQGTPIVVHEAYNEEDEAQYVIREIERLARTGGVRYRDAAVMYRTNAQSRPLEDAFVRMGVPYKLVGGVRFYERKEVKDVLAYLRLALNPNDAVSLGRVLNVPPRGIGDRTVAEIERWVGRRGLTLIDGLETVADGGGDRGAPQLQARAQHAVRRFIDLLRLLGRAADELPPLEVLDLLLEQSGYAHFIRDGSEEGEERWANISELRTKARDFADFAPPAGLAAMLEEVSLVQDVDTFEPESDGTTLITLHAAKGLEFPYVYIVGMEEGLCPHARSMDDPSQMEEERRLVYVGMTRAMRGLYLIYTSRRALYGNVNWAEPSRFIRDIPPQLLHTPFISNQRISSPGRATASGRTAPSNRFAPIPGPMKPLSPEPELPTPAVEAEAASNEFADQQYFPGDRVFHPAFGTGVVVSSALVRGDEEVTVAFEGKGVKKLSVAYAPLQRS